MPREPMPVKHDGALNARVSPRTTRAVDIAHQAGQLLLKQKADGISVARKQGTELVTNADLAAQEMIFAELRQSFPEHQIVGEEGPNSDYLIGSSVRPVWYVDPIDGTKSFVCGVPLYSTLVALEKDGQAIAGAIYIPATGQMVVAANKRGCWYRARGVGISRKKRFCFSVILDYILTVSESECEIPAKFRHFSHFRRPKKFR